MLYGEGSDEYTFHNFLLTTQKFNYLLKDWYIDTDHASGSSCEDVLKSCIKSISGKEFDVVLCFIDTDKLKADYPKNHDKKKRELEKLASENKIEIIWQIENLEEVLAKATKGKISTKGGLRSKLKRHEKLVLSSQPVKDIFNRFRNHK